MRILLLCLILAGCGSVAPVPGEYYPSRAYWGGSCPPLAPTYVYPYPQALYDHVTQTVYCYDRMTCTHEVGHHCGLQHKDQYRREGRG